MILMQLIINSLVIGSIYALVASGFSLIYSTNKFIHFAHGTSVVVSGYFLFTLFNLLNIPFGLTCVLTLIFSVLFGGLIYLIYLPLKNKNSSKVILLLASFALLIFFENLLLLIFGADVKSIGFIKVSKGLEIFGAIVTPLQIIIICVSLLLFVLLFLLMKKTKLGRDMRAVADNFELARVIGINSKKIAGISFLIGSLLAGIAGILIALEQQYLEPFMGTNLMVKGFTGAIIGGINFVPGSIIGSFILGIAENFGIWYLNSGYKDAIAFVLLFIFLLFKPNGLFGLKKGIKK